jgi:hypothetical protein
LAKQLKNKMTPTNIFKIKKGISIVLMIFGIVLITQGWFPKEKEMVKNAFENIENKQYSIYIILSLNGRFFMLICFSLQN